MHDYVIFDNLWMKIESLLPLSKPKKKSGSPRKDDKRILSEIFYPLRTANGKGTGVNPTDRGKKGTKRSILTDCKGIPLSVAVDGANRRDKKLVKRTLDGIIIENLLKTMLFIISV